MNRDEWIVINRQDPPWPASVLILSTLFFPLVVVWDYVYWTWHEPWMPIAFWQCWREHWWLVADEWRRDRRPHA